MATFREAWAAEIWPTFRDKREELLKERPARQGFNNDSATGARFGSKFLQKAAATGPSHGVGGISAAAA